MGSKTDEAAIYENILEMVSSEVEILAALSKLSYDDLKRLELLSKIYAALKDDLRQDVKHGILQKQS